MKLRKKLLQLPAMHQGDLIYILRVADPCPACPAYSLEDLVCHVYT